MSSQELEQQLLSLDLAERIRILQLLAQSLTVPSSQPSQTTDEIDLMSDRSPQHPRNIELMTCDQKILNYPHVKTLW